MSKEFTTVCKNCGQSRSNKVVITQVCCPEPDHRDKQYYLEEFEKWKKGFHINDLFYSEEFARSLPWMPANKFKAFCENIHKDAMNEYSNFLLETFY